MHFLLIFYYFSTILIQLIFIGCTCFPLHSHTYSFLSKFIFLVLDFIIFTTALSQVLEFIFSKFLLFPSEIARAEGSFTSARGIFDSHISFRFKAISIALAKRHFTENHSCFKNNPFWKSLKSNFCHVRTLSCSNIGRWLFFIWHIAVGIFLWLW